MSKSLQSKPLPEGQRYAVISVVAPNTRQKCDEVAVLIRGVFGTESDAKAWVDSSCNDGEFDVYVCDMRGWLVLPPPPHDPMDKNVHYADVKLNELMTSYREQHEASRRNMDERIGRAIAEQQQQHKPDEASSSK